MVPLSLAILAHTVCILQCIADTFDLNEETEKSETEQ